jgi:hypothetical protein
LVYEPQLSEVEAGCTRIRLKFSGLHLSKLCLLNNLMSTAG